MEKDFSIKKRKYLSTEQVSAYREYLTTKQAAAFLGRSPGAVRNLVLRKKIPFRKVSGRLMFLRSELVRWIESSPGVLLEEALRN